MLHFRFWLAFGALCALVAVGGGCGGSSSETPFPLEPDPSVLRPGAPARARYVALPRQDREPQPETTEPSQGLPSTWGAPAERESEPEAEPEPDSRAPELKNGR